MVDDEMTEIFKLDLYSTKATTGIRANEKQCRTEQNEKVREILSLVILIN